MVEEAIEVERAIEVESVGEDVVVVGMDIIDDRRRKIREAF